MYNFLKRKYFNMRNIFSILKNKLIERKNQSTF